MFGIGTSEILLILVLILLIYGPERLPGMIKKTSSLFGQVRRAADEVRTTVSREVQRAETLPPEKELAETVPRLISVSDEPNGENKGNG